MAQKRKKAEQQAKRRREQLRRRRELGDAVVEAGMAAWSKAVLSGLLLRAKEHFGDSEATRPMLVHRGGASDEASSQTLH